MKKFAATVSLCLPLLALAQTPPPPTAAAGGAGLPGVHAQLGLQPTQEAAWQKYEGAVNAYIALRYQERPVLASQDDAAPAQIRRLVDQHANRLAALEDIEAAAKALYAMLSPAQQKLANQSLMASIPVTDGSAAAASPAPADRPGRAEGRGHRGGGPGGPGGMGR